MSLATMIMVWSAWALVAMSYPLLITDSPSPEHLSGPYPRLCMAPCLTPKETGKKYNFNFNNFWSDNDFSFTNVYNGGGGECFFFR